MNRKAKRDPRRKPKVLTPYQRANQLRLALKGMVARYVVEVERPDKLDDFDFEHTIIENSPERTLELALADPNVYRTPKGNLLTLEGADGVVRWMTPAEAVAWQVKADVLDEMCPEGTRP